ncbi:MAG: hypothetical protein WD036_05985 [Bauldia sp.]
MRLVIILGPYRNLTTLTAAVLALHPHCQVLNHASVRLLPDRSLNFLRTPDNATYERFLAAAKDLSAEGRRGGYGGSILYSHAFEDARFRDLYHGRYGDLMVKPDATHLVWKDSMQVQRLLMERDRLFGRLCSRFPEMKFVLPMRDPLDCAVSNLKRPDWKASLGLGRQAGVKEALQAVLDAFRWVLDRRDQWPDRVFAFTQNDDPGDLFVSLAAFLGLAADERWLSDCAAAFVVHKRYRHRLALLSYARAQMSAQLGRWPNELFALMAEPGAPSCADPDA